MFPPHLAYFVPLDLAYWRQKVAETRYVNLPSPFLNAAARRSTTLNITTFSIMSLSIMTLSIIVECCYAVSFMLAVVFADCRRLALYDIEL
jgi:hypothetical protein